ncbi:MAG: hypothetical protein ACJ79H_08070 [Myxococcales bacterium]
MMLLLLALLAAPAQAARPDGGVGAADAGTPQGQAAAPDGGQDDEALRRELTKALGQDAAATAAQAAAPPTQAPASATGGAAPPVPLFRGSQSLNPDISAILDAEGGYQRRPSLFVNGDDPVLRGEEGKKAAGFAVQEVELAFSAIVDPYFRADVFLTIPNLTGLEVEEAFATTTSLPWNLQAKAGSFRSAFGRQNGQHLHMQDFTRRPLVNAAFLGGDGLRGPGAQVSWLAPLPFYLTLSAEAFSLGGPEEPGPGVTLPPPVASFGGGEPHDLTYAGEAKAFFPFGDAWSVYLGLSGATGVSPGLFQITDSGVNVLGANRRSYLLGADLYFKWKPPNVAAGYSSLAWQTEAIWRHLDDAADVPGGWDGGLYSQVVLQIARRWFLGLRGDVLGIPTSSSLGQTLRAAASVTFQASEFARVRAYVEAEHAASGPSVPDVTFPSVQPGDSVAAFLQVEISIGAHGAHPF